MSMSISGACTIYEQLAEWYERRGEPRQRDGFLALAADAALSAGRPDQAERCRQRLLQVSPYHLLRPYPTFADALQSPDVTDYLTDLRSQFPPDRAASLLEGLKGNAATGVGKIEPPTMANLNETLMGSPARPAFAPPSPVPLAAPRRRERLSPYDEQTAYLPSNDRQEAPTLTWVPGLLFLVVLFTGLTLAFYVLVGPFVEGR